MHPVSNVESFTHDMRAAYSRANTYLNPNHLRLFRDSGISSEVSQARGYQTFTMRSALKRYGFGVEQCGCPAPLIPIYDGGALESIARPDGRDVVSSSTVLSLFQQTEGLGWIDTKRKVRAFLRRLGFRSGPHQRERFWENRSDSTVETVRGYEIKRETIRDLLRRIASA